MFLFSGVGRGEGEAAHDHMQARDNIHRNKSLELILHRAKQFYVGQLGMCYEEEERTDKT